MGVVIVQTIVITLESISKVGVTSSRCEYVAIISTHSKLNTTFSDDSGRRAVVRGDGESDPPVSTLKSSSSSWRDTSRWRCSPVLFIGSALVVTFLAADVITSIWARFLTIAMSYRVGVLCRHYVRTR